METRRIECSNTGGRLVVVGTQQRRYRVAATGRHAGYCSMSITSGTDVYDVTHCCARSVSGVELIGTVALVTTNLQQLTRSHDNLTLYMCTRQPPPGNSMFNWMERIERLITIVTNHAAELTTSSSNVRTLWHVDNTHWWSRILHLSS